jgi:predicted lipid-binding transport protein (Tim44 family)
MRPRPTPPHRRVAPEMSAIFGGVLARAGGGHNFSGGGGGGGGIGGGGGGGFGGGHFFFFGGGGGGGAVAGIVIVVLVLGAIAFVVAAQRRNLNGEPLEPPAPYPHSDEPAMPGGWGSPATGATSPAGASPAGASPTATATVATGLDAIKAHDPAFNEAGFLADVERAFFTVEEAWTELKPDMSRQVMADGIWQQHRTQIEDYQRNGTRNVLEGLAVGKATITSASSDQTSDTITVRFLAACADYDVEVASGKVVRGNKHEMTHWQEDWTFQRSSSATTKPEGGTMQKKCPNCGAPLDLDLAGVCKYCKAPVMSGSYDWVLSRIDQVL